MAKRFARRCEHSSGQASLQTEQPIAALSCAAAHAVSFVTWAAHSAMGSVLRKALRGLQNPRPDPSESMDDTDVHETKG
jgi:hypothetical protein